MFAQSAILSLPGNSVSWTPPVVLSASANASTCRKNKKRGYEKTGIPRYPCLHMWSDTHEGSYPLKGSQRTILFLIADTGAGHRSAANAIRNAITFIAQKRQEEWLIHQQAGAEEQKSVPAQVGYRIEIVDVFEGYSRFPLREAVKLYGPAIRYRPKLYGRIFHLSNHVQRFSAMKTVSTP